MILGGKNFTNFQNVRVKGDSGGPGVFRIRTSSAFEGLLTTDADYADANYTYTLPAKTGGIGVTGTFTVAMPAIGAGAFGETNVVVAGIRAEDALLVTMQDTFNTLTTGRVQALLGGAAPGNGGIHMTFINPHGTATIANSMIAAYTTFR